MLSYDAFPAGCWSIFLGQRNEKVGPIYFSLHPADPQFIEILKIHLRDEVLAADVDLQALAKQAEHFSGSDLKRLFPTRYRHAPSLTSHFQTCASQLL
jgi:hypothetical protein